MYWIPSCLITAVFIVIYFSPFIVIENDSTSVFTTSQLLHLKESQKFRDSTIICMAASFPILLDFFADLSTTSFLRMNPSIIISKTLLVLSLFVPNLILFSYPIRLEYLPSIFLSRVTVLVLSSALSAIHYGGPIWTFLNTGLIIFFHGCGTVATLFSAFVGRNLLLLTLIKILSYVTMILVFVRFAYKWVIHLRRHKRYTDIKFEEHCTNIHMICAAVMLGGYWSVGTIVKAPYINPWSAMTAEGLCAMNYILCAGTVCLLVIFSRITRREEHLEQANRELEIKSSFVRYVSHEIRTPLNTVVMGLKYLHTDMTKTGVGGSGAGGNGEWVEVVEDLQSSCEVAVEILTNLLTYEKLTTNILILDKQNIPVRPFFNQTLRPFVLEAASKGVNFNIKFGPQLEGRRHDVFLVVDKAKISQVVRNLVSNALKFTTKDGDVEVMISVASVSVDDSHSSQSRDFSLKSFSLRRLNRRMPTFSTNSHTQRPPSLTPAQAYSEPADTPGSQRRQCYRILRVEVTDSGPGIAEENQKRLFKEIVQFNPGELQDGKGSGLGLWISHQIMTLHEGSLSVYSAGLGHGCTFTMELPLQDPEPLSDTDSPARRPSNVTGRLGSHQSPAVVSSNRSISSRVFVEENLQLETCEDMHPTAFDNIACIGSEETLFEESIEHISPHKGERVLIVDDAGLNRRMMIRVLRDEWEDISEAEDGRQAVELVRETLDAGNPFDIVLMDYQMPRMDGPTAAKRMREMGFEGIIIGVTGNALPIDIETYLSHGADKILIKPLQKESLLSYLAGAKGSGTMTGDDNGSVLRMRSSI